MMKTALIACIVAAGSMLPTGSARAHRRGSKKGLRGEEATVMFESMSMPLPLTEPTMTAATTTTGDDESPSEIGNSCDTGSYSWSNSCTSPNNYCSMRMGTCNADGVGTCRAKPMFCTFDYTPVCGCDGRTHANECVATGAGVNVEHEGECRGGSRCSSSNSCGNTDIYFCQIEVGACMGSPGVEQSGTCASYGGMTMCPMLWAPVCGCNRKVYSNSCDATSAGVNVARELDGLDFTIVPGGDCEIENV